MNSVLAASMIALLISLCIGLLGGLVVLVDLFRKMNRALNDTYALQRMVTSHGDAQLSADSRLSAIDRQLNKLCQRELQVRSMITSLSSIESASAMISQAGVTDSERLAMQSGLTEREANLMLQLRSAYSSPYSESSTGSAGSATDNTSPPDGAK